MKHKLQPALILALIIISSFVSYSQAIPNDSLYLGQTPPGNTPKVFAPDIISISGRRDKVITFSPDGQCLFFSIGEWPNCSTMFMEYKNGKWTSPITASFSNGRSVDEPFFSPDGKRVYYYAYPPGSGNNSDICYSERQDTLWSSPINLGTPLNTSSDEYHPCVVNDSSLYFISSSGKVCRSQYKNGVYESRVTLPTLINDGLPSSYLDPYVAPDESYLIFNSKRSGGYGGYDLYLSCKKTDGSWTNPMNLGNSINSSADEVSGDVTPDGKYMTFNRNNAGDIYWVSTRIIDSLRQTMTSVGEGTIGIPGYFQLAQNYPNPFNPSTKIKFSLAKNSFTKLEVFNLLGQKVDELINQELNSGYHEIEFNAANLTAGTYFYRIQAGEYSSVKKLILVK